MSNKIQKFSSPTEKFSFQKILVKWAVPSSLLVLGVLNGAAGNPALLLVGGISGVLSFAYPYLNGKRTKTARIFFLLVLGALSFSFINLFAPSAHAAFFQKAEEFFQSTFTSSGAAIPLVFNTLRALYIIYLAIAFIGVFNSVRQDEDWLTTARTPIIVVICVTLSDILTGLIIGS